MRSRRVGAGPAVPRRWVPAAARALLCAAGLGAVLLATAPAQQSAPVARPALAEASDSNPLPPTGVVITPGNGQFTSVRWTASTEPNTSGYVVKVGTYQTTVFGTSTTMPITGLVNGTDYTVQVFTRTSYNLLGLQTGIGTVPATATSYPRDGVAPARPTGVAAVRGDAQVTVTWAANTETDLVGYRVLRDDTVVSGTLTGRSFVDAGLTNDTTYRYTVQAVDVSRQWSASSTPSVAATPTDLTPPGTPTMLLAERGDRQVTLSWAANPEPDVSSYRLLRDGVEVATIPAGSRGYTDTGLSNDRTYRYALVAVDGHANRSGSTAAINATPTDLTPPAPPSGLAAARGETRVTLSWTANPEPDLASYRVLRDGVEVATVTGATSYTDTGLTNDVTYAYRLVAVDTHGNRSAASDPAVPATPTDLTPPAPPTGLAAVRGDGRVALTWTAGTEADLASYRVLRDGVEVATVTGATAFVVTGLTNDRAYTFALVAVDTHGNRSAASAPAVTATPTDLTPPAAPTGFAATRGDARVDLTWTANGEPDLAGYRLYRDGVLLATVTGTAYADTGLTDDRTYTYRLVAVDTHGNASPATAPVPATPTDLTAPAAPSGVTAVRGDGQVALGWAPNAEPDLASYRVLRDGVEVATVTGTSFLDTGLVNDSAHRYAVVAVDTHGNRSPVSAAVDATPTDLTPPGAPTGVAAADGERSVRVTWSPAPETDVVAHRVLGPDGSVLATVAAPATAAVLTGLAPGALTVTVVAVDGHGNVSAPSSPVSATAVDRTAPAVPTGLAGRGGDGVAVLTWTAPADPDVLAYRVLRDGVVVATVTVPTATVTGLVNGTSYTFAVQAVDPSGNASAVSAAAVVVPAGPPLLGQGTGETGGLAVSGDGRFVVVATRARLEPADTNTAAELYLLDRVAGTASRIAPMGPGATTADATNAAAPAVSDDGRYVVLATSAALVPRDTNQLPDVYRFDTRTRTWALVSVPASGAVHATVAGTLLQPGAAVHATSPAVAVSADGDLVLFLSERPDLVPGDTNGVADAFAVRMSTGAVTRVSTTSAGADLARTVTGPALALTPDGRFALFAATGPNGPLVLFRKTLAGPGAGELLVVSSMTAGARTVDVGVHRDTGDVDLSDDGRYAVFVTSARPDAPTTTWTTGLAYRKDLVTGVVTALGTGQTTTWEHQVALDPTGRYGFFVTAAALTPGDTNGHTDVFRRDLVTGELVLVTADAAGRPTTGPTGSIGPAEYGRVVPVTGDRVVLLTSQALVTSDTNRTRDLYVKDLATGAVS